MATKEDILMITQEFNDLAKAKRAPLLQRDEPIYGTPDEYDVENYLNKSLYGHNPYAHTSNTPKLDPQRQTQAFNTTTP